VKDIVYPKLSYNILNVLFKVHNVLGSKYQEKYYQRAIEVELLRREIPFEREKYVRVEYEGILIEKYYVDFVVDKKIILELKTQDFFTKKDYKQVCGYLNSLNL